MAGSLQIVSSPGDGTQVRVKAKVTGEKIRERMLHARSRYSGGLLIARMRSEITQA